MVYALHQEIAHVNLDTLASNAPPLDVSQMPSPTTHVYKENASVPTCANATLAILVPCVPYPCASENQSTIRPFVPAMESVFCQTLADVLIALAYFVRVCPALAY